MAIKHDETMRRYMIFMNFKVLTFEKNGWANIYANFSKSCEEELKLETPWNIQSCSVHSSSQTPTNNNWGSPRPIFC